LGQGGSLSHNFATPHIFLFSLVCGRQGLCSLPSPCGIFLAARLLLEGKTREKERRTVGEPAKVVSIEGESTYGLPEYSWEEVGEPGTYVEKETGDLYRIPKGLLSEKSPPFIYWAKSRIHRLIQLSKNPFITTFVARIICAEHNLKSNF
jgi:hypothetical protein